MDDLASLLHPDTMPSRLIATTLLTLMDGKQDHEIGPETGLPAMRCELVLFARDLALHHHGKDWIPDRPPPSPYKMTPPNCMRIYTDAAASHMADQSINGPYHLSHSDADRRYLMVELLRRGVRPSKLVMDQFGLTDSDLPDGLKSL